MPESCTSYTQKFLVFRHDGDHLGNVKPGALLRYAQQIATEHAESVGLNDAVYNATRTAYVLAKLALHIEHIPRVDEELTLVTQPESCKRAVTKRITHFYDIPFSLPMKMTKAAPEACEPVREPVASYSRCDMNGHLNNTRYADIICDALPWSVWEQGTVQDLMIFYHREVPRGESFTLSCAQTGEKQYYFNGEREGKSAFEASISFR